MGTTHNWEPGSRKWASKGDKGGDREAGKMARTMRGQESQGRGEYQTAKCGSQCQMLATDLRKLKVEKSLLDSINRTLGAILVGAEDGAAL